jgi:hypothetical protein
VLESHETSAKYKKWKVKEIRHCSDHTAHGSTVPVLKIRIMCSQNLVSLRPGTAGCWWVKSTTISNLDGPVRKSEDILYPRIYASKLVFVKVIPSIVKRLGVTLHEVSVNVSAKWKVGPNFFINSTAFS